MAESSHSILERFRAGYGKDIDLTLRPAYRDLLARLGNPQEHLPPVFHVAGTNGKGSTCAFLRAMLEAAGYKVHVYTSPHLVTFYERIRIAGELIAESELADILSECERKAAPGAVTYFEVITAAALAVFARHQADFTILEVGFGGRLDATNVVDKPLATLITRLSYDHREYLGDSLTQIAREKSGIMRRGVPCFTAPQPDEEALAALRAAAMESGAPLLVGGVDWHVEEQSGGFHYRDGARHFDLPAPALLGRHQYLNAGLAIAALANCPAPIPAQAIAEGLRTVEWPARLQRLTSGALVDLLPAQVELWLDGGHNDSAGEVLAAQIEQWRREDDANPRPLYIVIGMLTSKKPAEFLTPFAQHIARLCTVTIEGEALSFSADDLATDIQKLGIAAEAAIGIKEALRKMATPSTPGLAEAMPEAPAPRILICGSLYLAGRVLGS